MSNGDGTRLKIFKEYSSFDDITLGVDQSKSNCVGVLANGTVICPCIEPSRSIKDKMEYFYLDKKTVELYAREGAKVELLEAYLVRKSSPLYIRWLMTPDGKNNVVFISDAMKVLSIAARQKGQSAKGQYFERKFVESYKSFDSAGEVTMTIDKFNEFLKQHSIDACQITLVPDVLQQQVNYFSEWDLPFKTWSPFHEWVTTRLEAAFVTFKTLCFWKKGERRDGCYCRGKYETSAKFEVSKIMSMSQMLFISEKYFKSQLLDSHSLLCHECQLLAPKEIGKPLPGKRNIYGIEYKEMLEVCDDYGVPSAKLPSSKTSQKFCDVWMAVIYIFNGLLQATVMKNDRRHEEFFKRIMFFLAPLVIRTEHAEELERYLNYIIRIEFSPTVAAVAAKAPETRPPPPEIVPDTAKEPEAPTSIPQPMKIKYIPKHKRGDPRYKPNRAPEKPKCSKPPVSPALEPTVTENSDDLKDYKKMCQNAQSQLKKAKTKVLELRNKVQTTEQLEQKVKELVEEARDVNEAKDQQKREMVKDHADLVEHLNRRIAEWKGKAEAVADSQAQMEQKDKEIEELKKQLSLYQDSKRPGNEHLESKLKEIEFLKQQIQRLTQKLTVTAATKKELVDVKASMKRQTLENSKLKEEITQMKLAMTDPSELKELKRTLGTVEILNELNEQAVRRLVEEISNLRLQKTSSDTD